MSLSRVPQTSLRRQGQTKPLPGYRIRRVLRGAGVGGIAFAVLTALCMYADEAGNVRASADDLAYTAGVKLDTARRHLRALRADGTIELRERAKGRRPNTYHLPGADETPPGDGAA